MLYRTYAAYSLLILPLILEISHYPLLFLLRFMEIVYLYFEKYRSINEDDYEPFRFVGV